jgi:hypothetical protein
MRKRLIWLAIVVVECGLAWFAYQHAFLIKWPPQGPVRYFLGWGSVAIIFLLVNTIFWAVIGLIRLFMLWQAKDDHGNTSILPHD